MWNQPNSSYDIHAQYDFCQNTANKIKSIYGDVFPEIMMIMGTGLTSIDKFMNVSKVIYFSDLPDFPQSTAETHTNKFVIGTIGSKNIVVMCGRIHFYETNSPTRCAFPIRVMSLLGVKYIIVTAAVGSLRSDFNVGDFVIITDHIYFPGLAGISPLIGHNDERIGKRFIPLKECYNPVLNKHFIECTKHIPNLPNIHNGIYASVAGPHFETPAEVRFLRNAGCDVVGMSVCPEIVAAAHCGIKSMAVAIVTNICDDGTTISYSQQETLRLHANIANVSNDGTLSLFKIVNKFLEKFETIN